MFRFFFLNVCQMWSTSFTEKILHEPLDNIHQIEQTLKSWLEFSKPLIVREKLTSSTVTE